jgi:hypothetical protein
MKDFIFFCFIRVIHESPVHLAIDTEKFLPLILTRD